MAASASKGVSYFKCDTRQSIVAISCLVAAVILATVPLEVPELTLSLLGAIVYSVLQVGKTPRKKVLKSGKGKSAPDSPTDSWQSKQGRPWQATRGGHAAAVGGSSGGSARLGAAAQRAKDGQDSPVKKDYRQPSIAPIQAPTFTSSGFDAEVHELLRDMAPTAESAKALDGLVQRVKSAILPMIPEAEVTGFATGNLKRGKAFGVAVPDVDLVVSVSPAALVPALQQKLRNPHVAKLDARKLQKSAIRTCTDQLVAAGGFKFRRSAFKGQEPKVTLLAPCAVGASNEAIPVDFSVNNVTPLFNAALLTECGQLEPRSKELILLVHRWARDRGIAHAAKGHLPPYAWSLLTIYFLQVGIAEDVLLPSLDKFERASALLKQNTKMSQNGNCQYPKWVPSASQTSVAALFKEFVRFYETRFDWRGEAVSVRLGRREAPGLSLPIHVGLCADGTTTPALSVEDPFEATNNIGSFLTGDGCMRLREELKRAGELCSGEDASLSQLLEPWAPPEWSTVPGNEAGREDRNEE